MVKFFFLLVGIRLEKVYSKGIRQLRIRETKYCEQYHGDTEIRRKIQKAERQ